MPRTPLMYFDGTKWRHWECYRNPHDTIAIFVGGGPSLNKIDVSKLCGPGKTVFGVNTTYPAVRPDIWIGVDDPKCYDNRVFYESFPKILRGNYYDKELDNKPVKDYPFTYFASVKPFDHKGDLFYRIGPEAECFIWDKNVFVTTMNLILYMGYRKIYLAGVDFDNKVADYHHGQILENKYKAWNASLYSHLYHYLYWLYNVGKMSDIQISSISPDSKINKILPYISLEDLNSSISITKNDKFYHCGELDKQQQVLNILTTATPRSELHLKGLFQAILSISSNGDNIKWFVNLDCPSMFSASEVQKAIEKFKELEKLVPKLTLFLNVSMEGNFSSAGKSVFEMCQKDLDPSQANVFCWLEDDWFLKDVEQLLSELDKFFYAETPFITAGKCQYVCGNPLFFKHSFFNEVLGIYKKSLTDPELTFFEAVKLLYNTEEYRKPVKGTIHLQDCFKDIGREWRDLKGIYKEDKYKQMKNTWRLEDARK